MSDQNDIKTLIYLINSQSEQTRKELTSLFRAEIKSESEQTRKELKRELKTEINNVKSELNFKIDSLERKLDDKFEEHRRKIVDEIQTFQDFVVKDNLKINQELTVNSARVTKIEKHLFAN